MRDEVHGGGLVGRGVHEHARRVADETRDTRLEVGDRVI